MNIEKQTFRSGPFHHIFAQGVRVGDTLTLAGQISMDDAGNIVGGNDICKQVDQTYANIKTILAEFGADMSNITDETLFVTDMDQIMGNLETFCSVREKAYGGTAEVSQTLVSVAGLVSPELLVEIKCIAHL